MPPITKHFLEKKFVLAVLLIANIILFLLTGRLPPEDDCYKNGNGEAIGH